MKPVTTSSKQLAKHLRDVYSGGNWTASSLKDVLEGVNHKQATTRIGQLNSIALLVFHINYYVRPIINVLKGSPLEASDKFSFDMMPVNSEEEWQQLIKKVMEEAEELASEMEQLDDTKLFTDFADPKYGTAYRNLLGNIEHTHYHLGQIALIKKILNNE